MSAVLDEPRPVTYDPTAGLELVQGDEGNLQAIRHLFLAANLLDPARQRDTGMRDGGEELVNPCLRRTQGKVHKCEITPLEFWVEWIPKELFPEGMEHMALSVKDAEQPDANNRIFKPLFGYPYLPGHMIVDALGIPTGERRGIVEIENLRGVEYGKEDRELQALFFPPDYQKPTELRLVMEHIEKVAASHADPDVKDTAGFMYASGVQSREYMEQVVSKATGQLQERVTHQFVHRLTPKIRSFMAQLEMKPPMVSQVQDTVDRAISTLPPELVAQMNAQTDALNNLGPVIANAVQQAITAALAANKPAEPAPAPAPAKAK